MHSIWTGGTRIDGCQYSTHLVTSGVAARKRLCLQLVLFHREYNRPFAEAQDPSLLGPVGVQSSYSAGSRVTAAQTLSRGSPFYLGIPECITRGSQ